MKTDSFYIPVQITGSLPSGQIYITPLVSNADGIRIAVYPNELHLTGSPVHTQIIHSYIEEEVPANQADQALRVLKDHAARRLLQYLLDNDAVEFRHLTKRSASKGAVLQRVEAKIKVVMPTE